MFLMKHIERLIQKGSELGSNLCVGDIIEWGFPIRLRVLGVNDQGIGGRLLSGMQAAIDRTTE